MLILIMRPSVKRLSLIVFRKRLQAVAIAIGHSQAHKFIIRLLGVLRKQHLFLFTQLRQILAYLLYALTGHQAHYLVVNLPLLISTNRRIYEDRWFPLSFHWRSCLPLLLHLQLYAQL